MFLINFAVVRDKNIININITSIEKLGTIFSLARHSKQQYLPSPLYRHSNQQYLPSPSTGTSVINRLAGKVEGERGCRGMAMSKGIKVYMCACNTEGKCSISTSGSSGSKVPQEVKMYICALQFHFSPLRDFMIVNNVVISNKPHPLRRQSHKVYCIPK